MDKFEYISFRAMMPLFGVGVLTLMLTLCFCCYLWRLKQQGHDDMGYKVTKYRRKKKNSNEMCPVCLDEFNEGDKVAMTLPCNHTFHCKCLLQWLHNSACCPMCKTIVRLDLGENTHLVNEIIDGATASV